MSPKPSPDRRPSWRDPNLPVQRNYLLRDGRQLTSVTPEFETEFRKFLMETTAQPSWKNDPTYDLRRKK